MDPIIAHRARQHPPAARRAPHGPAARGAHDPKALAPRPRPAARGRPRRFRPHDPLSSDWGAQGRVRKGHLPASEKGTWARPSGIAQRESAAGRQRPAVPRASPLAPHGAREPRAVLRVTRPHSSLAAYRSPAQHRRRSQSYQVRLLVERGSSLVLASPAAAPHGAAAAPAGTGHRLARTPAQAPTSSLTSRAAPLHPAAPPVHAGRAPRTPCRCSSSPRAPRPRSFALPDSRQESRLVLLAHLPPAAPRSVPVRAPPIITAAGSLSGSVER